MNTRVDFYIINANNDLGKLQFVCKLLEKAYKQKHRVFVNCLDQSNTHQLDELLWTFNDISFIPHNIIGEGPEPAPPIQLGHGVIPNQHKDMLVNLTDKLIEKPIQFRRVAEIVLNDEQAKENARERYKQYRELGCILHSHDLTK